ncbi:hypothetical protein K7432_010407 [Basidiobolus ranarum]|uniref:BHLH domain-containing protein n=1 Tax=Basidiobolus ranarum TaxID=34480 RepID=A0ABR2VVX5_9FUNG
MPPLNFYKDQVDYSSYFAYSSNKTSQFASPFDEDNINDKVNRKPSQPPSDQPLFLNFTADLNPQNGGKKQKAKKSSSYKVNGVNILNRKSIDSTTALERLQKRRENHNSVERKRRDNINATILEISHLLPGPEASSSKPNKGNILRLAAEYIKELKSELRSVRNEVRVLKGEEPLEEEFEEAQEIRKRKNVDQESSDESDEDNEFMEKEDQGIEDEEDNCSSEQVSRQVSPEPSPEISLDSRRKHQDRDDSSSNQVTSVKDAEIKPKIEVPMSPRIDTPNDTTTSQPNSFKETVPAPDMAPYMINSLLEPNSFGSVECANNFPSYPILGGSKRLRADTHALPGMAQFAPINTSTLTHMHTVNAFVPRNTTPISPFGFQLPTPHTTPLTTPTNGHSHAVNHAPSVQSHQLPPHPHTRGPPHMMFREYSGSMNMY